MAQKSGAGGWFWLILGLLAGVGLTLAVLLFLNAGGGDSGDGHTLADDAAAAAPGALPEAPAEAPTARADDAITVPRPADAGIDPVTDDQIADDAAAAGMTSRTPPPPADGE